MTRSPVDHEAIAAASRQAKLGAIWRLVRYTWLRLIALFFTVVVGVYLTILIANMGGYVDDIRRGADPRDHRPVGQPGSGPASCCPRRNATAIIDERVRLAEKRMGLDQPFLVRSFRYLRNALTLNLGFADQLTSDSGSKQVRLRHPGAAAADAGAVRRGQPDAVLHQPCFVALGLSRRYGSIWDKTVMALAPTSAAPAWFYGLFLILIFAGLLRVLPFGGMVDAPPPENRWPTPPAWPST